MVDLEDVTSHLVSGKAGDRIFGEGDLGNEMYLVQQGTVELTTPSGRAAGACVLNRGDFFGEASLLEDRAREVTAVARSDFELVRIDRPTFNQLVMENPIIAVRMLRALSRRLCERPVRTTAVLLEKASGKTFTLRGDDNTIGRSDKRSGYSPDVDLADFSFARAVHRRHTRILRRGSSYFLRVEARSVNGAFVNDQPIEAGGEAPVRHGDAVRIGSAEFIFQLRTAPSGE